MLMIFFFNSCKSYGLEYATFQSIQGDQVLKIKNIMLQHRNMFSLTFLIFILSILVYHYFKRDPLESLKIITLRLQLKKALKEKMQAHVDNLKLVTMCKETEENNLKMLTTLQELNEKFVKKSIKYQKCRGEKDELQQEITLLKKLFLNG